ncbi:YeeE/YedE family protein [Marinoscillum furvescens]|uniref:Uncharacterized protein n=1 Tax=Marinoscillum furvescens DSM 4134 TaxID=1122208 RepID=A0A3D9L1Z6_MARFU|nr:YeeE/YedE thiosulfate transporter family protein [Marinoscillum furvescens]RED97416.1 hypothetical protein C7460_11225 [Marinoscillum furvescens DSM 4134]
MTNWLTDPWPWYVAGPLITLTMVLLFLFGKTFGVSSTLRTICSIGGAGKWSDFFKFDWRSAVWNLFFVAGAAIGGYIASTYMTSGEAIALSEATTQSLKQVGIKNPGAEFVPSEIFQWANLATWQGLLFMVVGGFLVGFGTRYAGGCTSGHAITGLSNLQLPSLIAVVGFFIGGLIVTHFIFPFVL